MLVAHISEKNCLLKFVSVAVWNFKCCKSATYILWFSPHPPASKGWGMAHWNQESRFPAAASGVWMNLVFLSQVLSMYGGGKAPSSVQPELLTDSS